MKRQAKVIKIRFNGKETVAKLVEKIYVVHRRNEEEKRIYIRIPKVMFADAYLIIPIDKEFAEQLKQSLKQTS